MLGGIENIKAGFDFKGGVHSGYERFRYLPVSNNPGGNDSVKFSPAAHYMSKVHWQVKQIRSMGKERVYLEFLLEDFEFHTEIDYIKLYNEPYHSLEIIKQAGINENKKYLLKMQMRKRKAYPLKEDEAVKLKSLSTLFERIFEMKIEGAFDRSDSSALAHLTDGLAEKLENEFYFIFGLILTFVEKMGIIKVDGNLNFVQPDSDPLIIEKIVTINE